MWRTCCAGLRQAGPAVAVSYWLIALDPLWIEQIQEL
jgi:hypothetical protein